MINAMTDTLPTENSDAVQHSRSAHRLDKIARSISSFLLNQVDRLEHELERCQKAVDNDKIVQRMLADFEQEKMEWDAARQIEIERLNDASEKLAQGWANLEKERRDWLENRGKKA
jgi:hypothetical protein